MRIAVTGPESSGKTTLSKCLAEALDAKWIQEFAREYLLKLDRSYVRADLTEIAKGQLDLWRLSNHENIQVCDTDMLVLKVWSEFKYGAVDPFILEQLDQQQFDLYLLCTPDLPWEEDPLREHPEQRDQLYELYHTELTSRGLPFVVIEGDHDQRIEIALSAIDNLVDPP